MELKSKSIPEGIGGITSLKSLTLIGAFKSIPTSIIHLDELLHLNIKSYEYGKNGSLIYNQELKFIPEIGLLKKIKKLKIEGFINSIPDTIGNLDNLEELEKSLMPSLDMLGVNNRNLKTFEVSLETSKNLSEKIPNEFVKVSESGISSVEAIKELKPFGYKGFLIGENFMNLRIKLQFIQ